MTSSLWKPGSPVACFGRDNHHDTTIDVKFIARPRAPGIFPMSPRWYPFPFVHSSINARSDQCETHLSVKSKHRSPPMSIVSALAMILTLCNVVSTSRRDRRLRRRRRRLQLPGQYHRPARPHRTRLLPHRHQMFHHIPRYRSHPRHQC